MAGGFVKHLMLYSKVGLGLGWWSSDSVVLKAVLSPAVVLAYNPCLGLQLEGRALDGSLLAALPRVLRLFGVCNNE